MSSLMTKDTIYILCGVLVVGSVLTTAVLVLWETFGNRKSTPKRHWREG